MYAHGELDLVFLFVCLIRKCRNRVAKYFMEWRAPGLTEICINQRPEMPRKVVTTSQWRKMFFFLVAITYTSPKVSVTANRQVPRKEEGTGSNLKYVSN